MDDLTPKQLAERHKLGVGRGRAWKPNEYPTYNRKRMVWRFHCAICQYHSRRRIYVCSKCGNCQSCGGLNQIGLAHQHCIWCGNGANAKPIPTPTLLTNLHAADQPQDLDYKAVQDKPSKKTLGITSAQNVHVSNPFNH
jgi:hypothetical protein